MANKKFFSPEINPFHTRDFQIVTQLTVGGATLLDDVIPAGTLLKSTVSGKGIELEPTKGAAVATVADVAEPLAVLAHDVVLKKGVKQYSVGVVIKGVVYQDVMEKANKKENFTDAVIEALQPRILTYNAITLGVK